MQTLIRQLPQDPTGTLEMTHKMYASNQVTVLPHAAKTFSLEKIIHLHLCPELWLSAACPASPIRLYNIIQC